MPLTPEEEKRLREEIRKKLEERLRKEKNLKKQEQESKQKQLEARLRKKIEEEEEERYYTEQGLIKYINRHGEVEWITPEEAEKRKNSRRSRKPSSHRRHRKTTTKKIVINVALIFAILFVMLFIYKFNPGRGPKTGALLVQSNIAGAFIYLDGNELRRSTPDTLKKLPVGRHYVTIFKEGYYPVPPMQKVHISKNKLSVISFELKNTPALSTIYLEVNVPGYKLYVDGMPFGVEPDGKAEVPHGFHTLMVVKSGYLPNPAYRRILITPNDTIRLKFDMIPESDIGYLQISNNLFRGYIYLDREFTGMQARAEWLPVRAGTYEIKVRENGYRCLPDSQLVNILPGEKKMVIFRLVPESKLFSIDIRSKQAGANIILDGKPLPYVTPVQGLKISPGSHFINLMRKNTLLSNLDQPIHISSRSPSEYYFDF